ncbi:DUF6913 domain-containing protein [Christiangramia aquimixticola]|uniref:DUF6913 domain-containing protein n=1 Tax=Christiangramia aquimixticola TaxID=1697558 RepID=UPI003AA98CD0
MFEAHIKRILHNRIIKKEVSHRKLFSGIASEAILVIIEDDDIENLTGLTRLYEKLPLNRDQIDVVCCNDASGLLQHVDVHSVSSKDIGLTGKVKSEMLERLLEKPYQFVITYFNGESLLGPLLTAKTNAQFKIGKTPDVFGIFDIEIRCETPHVFEQEIIKYFKILKNNN